MQWRVWRARFHGVGFGACGGPAVAHLPMPAWAECAIGAEPAPRSWSGQAASLDGDRPSCSRWAKWHPAPQSQRTHIPAPGVSLCRVLSLAVRCGEGLKVEEGERRMTGVIGSKVLADQRRSSDAAVGSPPAWLCLSLRVKWTEPQRSH